MNNNTIYFVICLSPEGRYVYSEAFSTKDKAQKFIRYEKEVDKRRLPGIKFRYTLEVIDIDTAD